ncbi:unnamed protein product [Meloidogyne enterolobii]|uniref:Uncharacterized protein n=1 Tax=Meloidogyne enterolobii TaxID=390850 RepID=A0ACB0XLQ4_MELEN
MTTIYYFILFFYFYTYFGCLDILKNEWKINKKWRLNFLLPPLSSSFCLIFNFCFTLKIILVKYKNFLLSFLFFQFFEICNFEKKCFLIFLN